MCDVNGFMYKIIIYETEKSVLSRALHKTIVLSLYKKYLQNQTIIINNFYTSVLLIVKLFLKNKHLNGNTKKKNFDIFHVIFKINILLLDSNVNISI